MLRLSISPSVARFREEFRQWLSKHPPPIHPPSHGKGSTTALERFVEQGRQWQATLASGRWLGVHWPCEYGGRGLSLVEESVIQEELVRVSAPQILGLFGLTMVGPVLIRHGTAAQRSRYLAKILSGQEIWCQGFSEPNAGSDLAAIRTKATPCEGGFTVQGHKVWTSFAHVADWCFLLCRTSSHEQKHQGLTYLLVDMRSPGISTRPLKQISGDDEFNEVYFDNVSVPRENVVGAEGEGWKIAISTLMFERVVLTFARQLQSEVALRDLLRAHGTSPSETIRRDLARLVVESCAVRALSYEHLLRYREGVTPGPEGSLDKLLWSESFQRIAAFALRCAGRDGLNDASEELHHYLYSRGRTIAAGTSEIQKGIIAQRILGLPKI